MSNELESELESDRAMVMNLESFGVRVDGAGYDETFPPPGVSLLVVSVMAEIPS